MPLVVVESLEPSTSGLTRRGWEHELDSGGGGRMLLLPTSLTNGSNCSRHLLLMLN